MVQRRAARNRNPAQWLLTVGLIGLGLTFWIPWAVAARTARTEGRADALCSLFLAVFSEFLDARTLDRAALETALARVQRLAAARGVFADDLELQDRADGGFLALFANKHYLFGIAKSPPADQRAPVGNLPPPIEVLAWPRESTGPAHAVFFDSQIADAAFTRNLEAGYRGAERMPSPGAGHRPSDPRAGFGFDYRGTDDERWLLRRIGIF
ncbi:MAG: hypothetical protein Fur0037_11230 [Planctomycetota bacterium]